MKKVALVLGVLALGACSDYSTMDANYSTTSLAPEYLMLTPDEQIIWAGMSEAERQRGIQFVTNGATLVSSLGSH